MSHLRLLHSVHNTLQYHMWLLKCMSITQNGWTPLISAAWQGKCDVVIDLLDSGADVNAQRNVSHYHLSLCHSWMMCNDVMWLLIHSVMSVWNSLSVERHCNTELMYMYVCEGKGRCGHNMYHMHVCRMYMMMRRRYTMTYWLESSSTALIMCTYMYMYIHVCVCVHL